MKLSISRIFSQDCRRGGKLSEVKKSYFICFTVRSGSTLLCQLLADTRLAGMPKEHFYHGISPDKPTGDEIADYRAYLERIMAEDRTANGVFGSKVGGGYWHDFVRRLRRLEGMAKLPEQELLDGIFPDLHYLQLTRRNKVRQAVSHWMAIASGRWHSPDAVNNPAPAYNYDAIDHLLQELIMREAVWAEFFAVKDIRPHVIVYEDFVQQPSSTLRGILEYLDIALPAGFAAPTPRFERMADELTEAWVQRFRREKQADWWTQFW